MKTNDKVQKQHKKAIKFALIGAVSLCASSSINSYAAISDVELGQVQNKSSSEILIKDTLKPGLKSKSLKKQPKGGANPRASYIDMYPPQNADPRSSYNDMYPQPKSKIDPKLRTPNWSDALQKPKKKPVK